jgi:adenylate kinase family enzyme
MKKYKAIILGPQCSGKTTLKKYILKEHSYLPLLEEDEMFVELNGGQYPEDIDYKENVLRPKLEEKIRQADNLIFLTSYCNIALIAELKSQGFKVIQLKLERNEFDLRNEKRMREEGYDDASMWANDIFKFHQEVADKGLVDLEIDATLPVDEISSKLLNFIDVVNISN